MKEAAYITCLSGFLEYGSCVWDPQGVFLQEEIEKVQNRFVTSNYCFETGITTEILENLRWKFLKKKRRDSRHTLKQRSKGCCQHSNR